MGKIITVLLMVIVMCSFTSSANAKSILLYMDTEWPNVDVVSKEKVWTITFNKRIDLMQDLESHISVYKGEYKTVYMQNDPRPEKIEVKFEIDHTRKKIRVIPVHNYEPNASYALKIFGDIKSENGKKLTGNIIKKFIIQDDSTKSYFVDNTKIENTYNDTNELVYIKKDTFYTLEKNNGEFYSNVSETDSELLLEPGDILKTSHHEKGNLPKVKNNTLLIKLTSIPTFFAEKLKQGESVEISNKIQEAQQILYYNLDLENDVRVLLKNKNILDGKEEIAVEGVGSNYYNHLWLPENNEGISTNLNTSELMIFSPLETTTMNRTEKKSVPSIVIQPNETIELKEGIVLIDKWDKQSKEQMKLEAIISNNYGNQISTQLYRTTLENNNAMLNFNKGYGLFRNVGATPITIYGMYSALKRTEQLLFDKYVLAPNEAVQVHNRGNIDNPVYLEKSSDKITYRIGNLATDILLEMKTKELSNNIWPDINEKFTHGDLVFENLSTQNLVLYGIHDSLKFHKYTFINNK